LPRGIGLVGRADALEQGLHVVWVWTIISLVKHRERKRVRWFVNQTDFINFQFQ
jgi:hypothetical protein